MTLPRPARLARLTLAVATAALAAAFVLLFATGHDASAHGSHQADQSSKAAAFTAAMDKLWEDHVTWTRMVIVDFAAGLPDLKTAEARLLRNQADIGNAIKPYYGAAAGAKLTQLLRTHILEAVPVLVAAKAGDTAKLNAALRTWDANGRQIAAFLTKANPDAWPLPMTSSMMKRHLRLTTAEAAARIGGHWAADVAAYDRVHAEILQMSHMLGSGIVAQFPDRF
ncbi:MAG TPA: hypothetical protein VFL60_04050 [Gaiellaceae bacterium]|nr:hypothetical protein [Gaiellaceae bacterium]